MQNKGKHKRKGKPINESETTEVKHKKTVSLLSKGEEYYQTLFDTIPHGIQEIDVFGKIIFVNKAYNKIFGYEEGEVIGKSMLDKLLNDSERKRLRNYLKTLVTDQPIPTPHFDKNRIKDGSIIDIQVDWNYKRDNEGHVVGFISVITDVTKTKQAEDALRRSEEKYYKLIEHANDAIISTNPQGTILGFNRMAEQMFGYSREEILGKSSELLVAEQNREEQKEEEKKLGEIGSAHGSGQRILEWTCIRKNGEEFPIEFTFYSIEIRGEVIANSIVRDVSKRKEEEKKLVNYQKKLKALTKELTSSEQKERQHIADFLHDEVGQELFATKLQLELLKNSISSPENTKTLDNALNNLYRVINRTRTLTNELSSPILKQLGLEKALEWLGEQTYKKYDILVTVEDDRQEKPLDDNIKLLLYQAVSELLSNVAKHARAKSAVVSIRKDNSNVRVCVKDNGVGFLQPNEDFSNVKNGGVGLFRIKERLGPLGGQLEIESQLKRGTQVILLAPLKNTT